MSSDVSVFSPVHTNTLNLRFQKPPLWEAFSETSVFDRISVDGRQKRIKKYAFSYENALVWTGPKTP